MFIACTAPVVPETAPQDVTIPPAEV